MGKLAEQTRAALDAKRTETAAAWKDFADLRDEMTEKEGDPSVEEMDELESRHKSYEERCAELQTAESRWDAAVRIDGSIYEVKDSSKNGEIETKADGKSTMRLAMPGERFVQSDAYKALVDSGALKTEHARVSTAPVEVWTIDEVKLFGKALVTGAEMHTTIVPPERLAGVDAYALPPITVLGLVNSSTTSSDTVEWVRVDTFTNAAVEVAEATDIATGGLKPQSDLTYNITQSPVQTIAHWIAATRQALADAARLSSDIDTYLRAGIQQRLELQILKGNGTAPNLRGILNTTGILTAGPGTTTTPVDNVFAGIAAIQAQFEQPTAVLMNPVDFGTVRLGKDTTGSYYYGPPNIVGPSTIWGLPVVTSPNMTAGFALVGDFSKATLWTREGVTVTASSEHADFFIRNLVAILAEGRWAFGVRVPKAFCLVDLLP